MVRSNAAILTLAEKHKDKIITLVKEIEDKGLTVGTFFKASTYTKQGSLITIFDGNVDGIPLSIHIRNDGKIQLVEINNLETVAPHEVARANWKKVADDIVKTVNFENLKKAQTGNDKLVKKASAYGDEQNDKVEVLNKELEELETKRDELKKQIEDLKKEVA
jgi:hypothetical protein